MRSIPRGVTCMSPYGQETAAWCGLCYANKRGRSNHKGHRGYRSKPLKHVNYFPEHQVKKPTQEPQKTAGAVSLSDTSFSNKHPHITEYLCTEKWEDGTARDPSALSISVREGYMSLALNDKDLKQSLYTQAETLAEALKLMEGCLKDGTGVWRPWKAGKRK